MNSKKESISRKRRRYIAAGLADASNENLSTSRTDPLQPSLVVTQEDVNDFDANDISEEFDAFDMSDNALEMKDSDEFEFEFQDSFYESDDESDEEKTKVKLTLAQDLLLFMVMFNCSKAMMSYLLEMLTRHGIDVPKTVYLLKKERVDGTVANPSVFPIPTETDGGKFAYLSILENLKFAFKTKYLQLKSPLCNLKIQVFIDGLPLFKSSKLQLWPILFKISPNASEYLLKCSFPLPIAVFCGFSKPKLMPFLDNLVKELMDLKKTPTLDDISGHQFVISDISFIADAPAKAFLQGTMNFNSYLGCGYCRIRGTYYLNHIIYEDIESELRTDAMYAAQQENNQSVLSPLASVIPLRSAFPVDYMHNILVGNVKKIFEMNKQYLILPFLFFIFVLTVNAQTEKKKDAKSYFSKWKYYHEFWEEEGD